MKFEAKNRIKVFISSGCGKGKERYNDIRKRLKYKIEETGFAQVFLFEDSEYASTQTAKQVYLRELDDSHICIFLIDNADGVFDGVAPEIRRAKGNSIKSIYLFCTERSTEPTWAQKELLGATGAKFHEVSSFDGFLEKGFKSLLNDIVDIYCKYCKQWLVDPEFDMLGKDIAEIGNVAEASSQKSLVANIDNTKIYLSSYIFDNNREVKATSKFDECCVQFLKVVLGQKSISEFNPTILLQELERIQSPELHNIVQLRWNAIVCYCSDDLEKCLQYLEQAKQIALDNAAPQWLVADILIDHRNVTMLLGNINSTWILESEAQKELDTTEEVVYFPVLDRIICNYYEELDKSRNKDAIKSPYTCTFGNNIDSLSDYIASAFVVSVFMVL